MVLMESSLHLLLLPVMIFLLISFKFFCAKSRSRTTKNLHETCSKLPPGPPPLPIVGNLFELGTKPHESFTKLSKLYGPLITLKLGRVTTVIASSPLMAKQILQIDDHILATRAIPDAVRSLNHHQASMVWLPPKQAWRSLRKLCNSEIFNTNRLNATQGTREQKINQLLDYIESKCSLGESVDIRQVAFATVLNLISYSTFSLDLVDIRLESMGDFKMVSRAVMDEVGRPNVSDYFPVLKLFDLQGVRRRTIAYFKKLDGTFDGLIKARVQLSREFSQSNHDLLDALLYHSNEDGSKLSSHAIKTFLKDIFIAGSDTTSNTVEWAMAELLSNPQKMAKAKAELKERIEEGKKPIQEYDIPKLPYLQAIVKETLRLHPPAPLLLPRKAEADVELCGTGFTVPKDARVLVNVWAIGRDAEIWKNPTKFVPERFLGANIGFKGSDFELVPFGAGRRICPGLPLADRMVHLMLASLLHCFDWKLEGGTRSEDLNMEEKFGLTLAKAQPLLAIPIRSW